MGWGDIQQEASSAACSALAANERLAGSGFLKEPVTVLEGGEPLATGYLGRRTKEIQASRRRKEKVTIKKGVRAAQGWLFFEKGRTHVGSFGVGGTYA